MKCELNARSVQEAICAIHSTALELLGQDGLLEAQREGLELIVLLSRYKRDVRTKSRSKASSEPVG